MSDKTLTIMPTMEDLLAAGVAAAAGAFQSKSPANCAMEQLVSQIVGKNLAVYVEGTNGMTSGALPVPVMEQDMLTGVVRGGYHLYKGSSNKETLMRGVGGVLSSVIGRELKKSFFPSTSA